MKSTRTPEQTAELKAEVRRRRQAGEGYQRISKALGLNKGQVWRWGNNVTVAATDKAKRFNLRRQKFAVELLKGKTAKDAASAATGLQGGSAEVWAARTMGDDRFTSAFLAMLDRTGLTEGKIAQRHLEALDAHRTHIVDYKGVVTDKVELIDNTTRLNAVELAWKVRGRLEQAAAGAANVQVQVMLNLGGPTQVDDSIDISLDSAEATGDSTTD